MPATARPRLGAIFGALVLCGLCGCTHKETRTDQTVYRFDGWLIGLVFLAGLATIPFGRSLARRNRPCGWALLLAGPLFFSLGISPSLWNDEVIVDGDHFESRCGFWWSPTRHRVRFADLREIRCVGTPRRRGRPSYSLRCTWKSGERQTVEVKDLLREALPEILEQARASGVTVRGAPDR
jgi:hypothetical protein